MSDIQKYDGGYNQLGIYQDSEQLRAFRESMQNFTPRLNAAPDTASVDKTADGKAGTILISHIQMLLDEYFFGLWSESEMHFQQIGNEIVGTMLLTVVHPVWGKEITRCGAAAIVIMVDAVPEGLKWFDGEDIEHKKARNLWALDMQNKKSNALDMSFPKLKTECLKNAANSFGKFFGRDLNRKKQDTYNPLQPKEITIEQLTAAFEEKKDKLSESELQDANRILGNKEKTSYLKLLKLLQSK